MAIVIALSSCSNDDDNNKKEFFNLKVGNEWVYKKYNVNNAGVETYIGEIDTVKVVGIENIDGKDFYRLTHTNHQFMEYELLRENEMGYLVSSTDYVVHPGTDKNYTESRTILNGNGIVNYSLKDVMSINVDDVTYEVYPFSGYYTPSPGIGGAEGEGVIEAYAKGIGFVIRHYKYVAGAAYFEYRLVSYDLK